MTSLNPSKANFFAPMQKVNFDAEANDEGGSHRATL